MPPPFSPVVVLWIAVQVSGGAVVLVPTGLLLSYGVARAGASLCNELRNAVFAKVSAQTVRSVGFETQPGPGPAFS